MMFWLITAGVIVVLGVVAWVTSGPRFAGKTRGRRPDHSSDAEQHALLQTQQRNSQYLGGGGMGGI